jgi:Sec-independent protein translocase protein TatA
VFDSLASPFHWLVILVVLLTVLGPNEGMKAARAAGGTIEQLRRLGREPIDELLAHVSDTEPHLAVDCFSSSQTGRM